MAALPQSFFHDLAAIFGDPYVALIFLAALAFDFINGFHDAANSIATIVGTRVMRPGPAVLWAAWWNFAAAWIFGLAVANTVAKWVRPEYVNPDVILAEDWIPEVPGINVPGDYLKDYAPNPWAHSKKVIDDAVAGNYKYFFPTPAGAGSPEKKTY